MKKTEIEGKENILRLEIELEKAKKQPQNTCQQNIYQPPYNSTYYYTSNTLNYIPNPSGMSQKPFQPNIGNPNMNTFAPPNQYAYPPPNQVPYPTPNQVPYPTSNQGPYPPPNQYAYPPQNQYAYPPQNQGPYPAPNQGFYPPPNQIPFAPTNRCPGYQNMPPPPQGVNPMNMSQSVSLEGSRF